MPSSPLNGVRSEVAGLAQLAEAGRVGMWFTPASGPTVWTGVARDLLRMSPDGAVSCEAFLRCVETEDRSRVSTLVDQAAAAGRTFVTAFRTSSQPVRFLRAAGRAVRDAGGKIVLVEGVISDETQEVQLEAKFAFVAETNPALLWVMNPDGFCSFLSQSWYDFTGLPSNEALGRGWLRVLHPQDLEAAAERVQAAIDGQMAFNSIHRMRHHSGDWHWVLCVGKPRFSVEGRFLGHLGALTDIEGLQTEPRLRESLAF